jgi:hypothetical protein
MVKEVSTGGGSVPQPLDTTDSPTFSALTLSGLTADRVVYANGSKQLTSSDVTSTSLNYLSGLNQSLSTSQVPTFRSLDLIRTSNYILLHLNHNASSGHSANYTEVRLDSYVNSANLCNKISFYNRANEMASIECWTTSFYAAPEIIFKTQNEAMKIDDYQNILINQATRPENSFGALSIKKGTIPTATTADQIDIYATTDTATTIGINTEETIVSEGFTQDST